MFTFSHFYFLDSRINCDVFALSIDEPVWAIGTGLVCGNEDANEIHKFVRTILEKMYDKEVAENTRIQYGGSVTPDSVDGLMAMSDIDGCLVGGASLFADKFARIVNFKKE